MTAVERPPISAAQGLTTAAAAERRAADGPNRLPTPPPVRTWRRLAGQLTHFFALMLWAALALALVAGMPQLGIAIFVVILVNYKAVRARKRAAT